MTANQINYAKHLEGVRHNIADETEVQRANKAREYETNRSNRQFELIGFMNASAAQANAAANARNAQSRAVETVNAQIQLHNQAVYQDAQVAETQRHNIAMEDIERRKTRLSEARTILDFSSDVGKLFTGRP